MRLQQPLNPPSATQLKLFESKPELLPQDKTKTSIPAPRTRDRIIVLNQQVLKASKQHKFVPKAAPQVKAALQNVYGRDPSADKTLDLSETDIAATIKIKHKDFKKARHNNDEDWFHQEDKESSHEGPVAPSNVKVDGTTVPASVLAASDFWGTKTPPPRTRTASSPGTSQEVDPQNVVELTKDQTETANEMVANQ